MKSRKWSLLLAMLLVGAWLLPACRPAASTTSPASPTTAPEVGALAPNFSLPLLDETWVTFTKLRGKPVLLNFWATWCPPCRTEMPYLQSVFNTKEEQGLIVLAVDIGENRDIVAQFAKQYGLTFPIALDRNGNVARNYAVSAIPTTFLIDADGVIRVVKVGAFRDVAELMEELRAIMP